MSRIQPIDLSGLWSGWYAYGAHAERVPFTASIVETDGEIEGLTLEPNTFAPGGADELEGAIYGRRHGFELSFEKRYSSHSGAHAHPIFYDGEVDRGLTLIKGEWAFDNAWVGGSGAFELARSTVGALVAVKRRAAEPVDR